MSGGFDSTVASYLSIKRGLKTHFIFFNLGGIAHEIGLSKYLGICGINLLHHIEFHLLLFLLKML